MLTYPVAVIAVGYAFCAGRGRRWAWAAYGLLVPPVLVLLLAGNRREVGVADCALIILGFVALLGWYDLRRIKRGSADSSANGTEGTCSKSPTEDA